MTIREIGRYGLNTASTNKNSEGFKDIFLKDAVYFPHNVPALSQGRKCVKSSSNQGDVVLYSLATASFTAFGYTVPLFPDGFTFSVIDLNRKHTNQFLVREQLAQPNVQKHISKRVACVLGSHKELAISAILEEDLTRAGHIVCREGM